MSSLLDKSSVIILSSILERLMYPDHEQLMSTARCDLLISSNLMLYVTSRHAAVDPEAISEFSSVEPSSDASTPRLRLQNGAHVSIRLMQKVSLSIEFTLEAWYRLEVSFVALVWGLHCQSFLRQQKTTW